MGLVEGRVERRARLRSPVLESRLDDSDRSGDRGRAQQFRLVTGLGKEENHVAVVAVTPISTYATASRAVDATGYRATAQAFLLLRAHGSCELCGVHPRYCSSRNKNQLCSRRLAGCGNGPSFEESSFRTSISEPPAGRRRSRSSAD